MNESGDVRVGIRELKARLSRYIRMVKNGKIVIVTEYGKPVGWILPYTDSIEDRLHAAAQAGILSWNGEVFRPAGPVAKVRGDKTVADIIIEDRE